MSQQRTRQRVSSSASSPLARRKLSVRNLQAHQRAHTYTARTPRTASRSPDSARVLVPLYPNPRRIPTRQSSMAKAFALEEPPVRIGGKRKREGPANENHAQGRSTRGDGRTKRRKALNGGRMEFSSDEDELSSMDVDDHPAWSISDGSDTEQEEEEQSSDDYLIHSATTSELQRLRKNDLVRLYHAAGLSEDAESLTRQDIIGAIISARDDDDALGPPSSPPRDGLSDCSSDDGGNAAADEDDDDVLPEVRASPMYLRRRATYQGLDSNAFRKKPKTAARSMSMGNVLPTLNVGTTRSRSRGSGGSSNGSAGPRRRTTSRGSTSSQPYRPRTRKTSNNVVEPMTPVAMSRSKNKSVEFSELPKTPSAGRSKSKQIEEESDLTELDELEDQIANPSPRRLRSKDKENPDERRITPMRKAKGKIKTLREEDSDLTDSDGELPAIQAEEQAETEEVDELMTAPVSSTSTLTPPQSARRLKRSPMKKRLRSRQPSVEEQPDDGDDELTDLEEESVDGDHALDMPTPRKLRNGKVVGEEADDEIEEVEEEAGNVSEETIGESSDDESTLSEEVEEEEEEEAMEDDIDLTAATTKSLTRLRKDDLVRLCESRDIDVSGTKPQLAEALVKWRDTHLIDPSPSSSGTVRPPSTIKRRPGLRNRSDGGSISPPVLERSHRVHLDEPKTPPLSPSNDKQPEPELELDLEALGLNDREIPPDKITKLEKIGSGGFKDVYIGKWGKRKVAISEFRGQLTEMDIKELKLLGGFNHENIVRFFGVSIPENSRETPVMIISELCTNGDLFDYIRNVDAPPLHRILRIMLSVAKGLEYLHLRKPSVIHRDCKSSNILITRDGSAKIADFGLAKVKQSTRSMVRSLVGTVNWQAPELWHAHPKYNHKVDVFSCALVYWEMMQWHLPKSKRKYPWEGMNEHAIYEAVGSKRQRPSVAGLRKQYCPEIVDLMERMWAQEPNERPTMSQVVTEVESILKQYKR
ncbi:hypothetical protein EV715DRAFT_249550 [Schizophyllum commune]